MTENKVSLGDRFALGLDKLIGFVNPRAEYRRKVYRQANGIMAANFYKGANRNRLKSSWIPGGGSADENLISDLPTLRERSRDLNSNDPRASGITRTVVNNTVGTGIRLQSNLTSDDLGLNEEQRDKIQKQCETAWKKWCQAPDASNRMDFNELQRLIDRQILECGEALFLPIMLNDPTRHYSLALDIIEPDRLRNPFSETNNKNIRGGVKVGSRGEPLSYFISETHPGDYSYGSSSFNAKFKEIPAFNEFGRKNIIHIYEVERPGQTRGIPFFAPALDYFKHLSDYEEAELVASRVAACFALLIETESSVTAGIAASSETDGDGKRLEKMEPGMIKYLNAGEKLNSFNPQRPGGNFDPFVYSILRAICAGLNLPYELVSKDFSKTNYSSARAALLQAYRYFQQRQSFLASKLCQPVYEMVMEEAWLRGEIDIPDYYSHKYEYNSARWITPGWQWVDPLKEAEAADLSISKGLSTLADQCAAKGDDWEDQIIQRGRELKKIKETEEKYQVTIIDKDKKVAPAKVYPSDPQPGDKTGDQTQ